MELFSQRFNNGVRVVHHPVKSPAGYCGLFINTGSRDELPNEHGLAHFIEHVIFKGTKKRKNYHILSRIDDVGGELNAYTTKEETCIYASFLKNDFERSVELFADIVFNSTFPARELEKEKEVIIDEINSYRDNPAELIMDDFEELIFPDDPMGRNILGTAESVERFVKADAERFMASNYNTDQMVLCSVGDIAASKIFKIANKYFGNIPSNTRVKERPDTVPYIPRKADKEMDTFQSHIILGNTAYDLNHPKRPGLLLLNNILGGSAMNSRLNMALREKNGIAYNVESIYSPCFKTGVFTVYFGTDIENIDRSFDIVYRELKKLRSNPLGILQLHNAKRQLKGQITISSENREGLMQSIGKSFLLYNKVDSLEDIHKKIDAVTSAHLLEIASEILDENQLSHLIYRQRKE